jgi:hypothetical protein
MVNNGGDIAVVPSAEMITGMQIKACEPHMRRQTPFGRANSMGPKKIIGKPKLEW